MDLALVGGGLANSLIALGLRRSRSPLTFVLVERSQTLGGNHTWSFHDADLGPQERALVDPLVSYSWGAQDVRFPRLERTLRTPYHSIRSAELHDVVTSSCGDAVLLGADVVALDRHTVALGDGRTIEAKGVIDGRGFVDTPHLELGFQKFLGQILELRRPHGIERPVLMDATVEQQDGYRFVYVLPFTERRILVEDTRYSDRPELPRRPMRDAIARYAETTLGVDVSATISEEEGILPVVLSGDIEAFWRDAAGVARSGLRAALFHPTTGYSLAEAARFATSLAHESIAPEDVFDVTYRRSVALWKRGGFFRLLNRMLFRAAAPEERYRVLQRFYGLSEPLIERFYAGHPTLLDKARLLTGRPPVPIRRAIRCLGSAPLQPSVARPRT